MTIEIHEKWSSPRLGEYSAEFETQLFGTDDYITALNEAQSAIPLTFFNGSVLLYRTDIKIDRAAEEIWNVSISYGTAQEQQNQTQNSNDESDFRQQFEIGGGTQRVTHSKETIAKYTSAGPGGVDFGGGINVNESGVEGVDIVVPTLSFSETRNFVASQISSLRAILFSLCGKVNSSPFMGFARGEVLYVGASGGLKGGANPFGDVTHKFIASPNLTGLTVGAIGGGLGFEKEGHHYMWVNSTEAVDATNNRVFLEPKQVNIERVYDYVDLNLIPDINNYGNG